MPNVTDPHLPDWVPQDVIRYLHHTELGISLRKLAKEVGCHPSTVMRQIRKIEELREDPLVEAAVINLADVLSDRQGAGAPHFCADADIAQDAERLLMLLSQPAAVMIVGEDYEKALIISRDEAAPETQNRATVELGMVQVIALCSWISLSSAGMVRQYRISPEGRAALVALTAAREEAARARSESLTQSGVQAIFFPDRGAIQPQVLSSQSGSQSQSRRVRYGVQETPLQILSRLTDRDGAPFLTRELVRAGTRLREDYELAQIGEHVEIGAAQFRDEPPSRGNYGRKMSQDAFQRVNAAMVKLGPGLSDIAIRCCCHLEGLEAAEKELGWSARSGKVVLRIALEHLQAFYDEQSESFGMIG